MIEIEEFDVVASKLVALMDGKFECQCSEAEAYISHVEGLLKEHFEQVRVAAIAEGD